MLAPGQMIRVGFGYDIHPFKKGRPLVLGGVSIPHPLGLAGHSDADVVCHAIADSLLGAACLGDLGRHFPNSDPRWKGASSLSILSRVALLLRRHKTTIINIDAMLIAERPKIAPYQAAMRINIARSLKISADRVSLKATTNEGLGSLGRGQGLAAMAVALVLGKA